MSGASLVHLECLIKTIELGNFSQAARVLGLTPAAVSKNVARLEQQLGVRLLHRTTRSVSPTESGWRLYHQSGSALDQLRQALQPQLALSSQPAGTLKVSLGTAFGRELVMPLMPEFIQRYPHITLDWRFENRRVNLVQEGYDAAIGAGFELDSRVVARELLPILPILVAAPSYLATHGTPGSIDELNHHQALRLRSPTTGRLRDWHLSDGQSQLQLSPGGPLIASELEVLCDAALLGMGIALLGYHHVHGHLNSGRLVRLLPQWHGQPLSIAIYYAAREGLEPKVRVLIDFLLEAFQQRPELRALRQPAT